MAADSKIFFFHIPKCAGTSVWRYLGKIYGHRRMFQIANADDVKSFNEMTLSHLRAYSVIGGHHFLSTYRDRLGNFDGYFRVTAVRDPIERLISFYNFIRKDRKHPRFEQVRYATFEEFSLGEAPNSQTQLLTGSEDHGEAIEVLDGWFDYYTVTERADDLMHKLSEIGNVPAKRALHKNVSRKKVRRQDVDPALISRLQQIHGADLRLYDHARAQRC